MVPNTGYHRGTQRRKWAYYLKIVSYDLLFLILSRIHRGETDAQDQDGDDELRPAHNITQLLEQQDYHQKKAKMHTPRGSLSRSIFRFEAQPSKQFDRRNPTLMSIPVARRLSGVRKVLQESAGRNQ
jgi:hypothetical protein